MRILHTSDWHVGRTIRGRSRADEHREVLDEIVTIAQEAEVDAILVTGDQFDIQSPSAESEQIVWQAFGRLAAIAPVVTIAGNHDNPRRLEAVRGLLAANDIHAIGQIRAADQGGVVALTAKSGERLVVAGLPFLHHRNAVRADAIIDPETTDLTMANAYSTLYHRYCAHLLAETNRRKAAADGPAFGVLMGHVSTFGATVGGGERDIHLLDRYAVNPTAFSPDWDWVALGHIHAAQQVANAPVTTYCGAPLQLDFGEVRYQPEVSIVTLRADGDPQIVSKPIVSGKRLLTYRGEADDLAGLDVPDQAWIRVIVTGVTMADTVANLRDHFGDQLVDIRVDRPRQDEEEAPDSSRLAESPRELFSTYCAQVNEPDERVVEAFNQLLDEVMSEEVHAFAIDETQEEYVSAETADDSPIGIEADPMGATAVAPIKEGVGHAS